MLWTLEEKLARERPELGHALPFGCVDEAAVPARATPLRLDVPIPPDVLARVRFRNARGVERALPVAGGKLAKPSSIQNHVSVVRAVGLAHHAGGREGAYRLTPESAAALDAVLAAAS